YGDTPQGMLESALEFARVCQKNDYHDFIFSMKSSNPQVMVHAYRLLVAKMNELGWDYPLHLGVTEAGQGEDGRIKSAMGIGTLLLDGIGETIRVSLTEDAWQEIDPCKRLIQFAEEYAAKSGVKVFEENFRKFDAIKRRAITLPRNVSMHRDGTVIISLGEKELEKDNIYELLGCGLQLGKPKITVNSADNIALINMPKAPAALEVIKNLHASGVGLFCNDATVDGVQVLSLKDAQIEWQKQSRKKLFTLKLANSESPIVIKIGDEPEADWSIIEKVCPTVIALSPLKNRFHTARKFFEWIQQKEIKAPVILNFSYDCSMDDLVIRAAAECGALLCDGLGDGIWLEGPYDVKALKTLSFGILQAARMRMSKTDFISCPSCGRTLFDLQNVTKRIHARTSHLPGVKIAIMGCIVNGPGEMADADFGYVGSKPGMIDLYIGKTCVEKDISFAEADDRLVELIKKEGRWLEPITSC
nr:flavodoxin-dependent (E)-4-hydroxy-3-methylbut-2-enyl-diphosphate synthase [Parachlamydiaceae bacterium]